MWKNNQNTHEHTHTPEPKPDETFGLVGFNKERKCPRQTEPWLCCTNVWLFYLFCEGEISQLPAATAQRRRCWKTPHTRRRLQTTRVSQSWVRNRPICFVMSLPRALLSVCVRACVCVHACLYTSLPVWPNLLIDANGSWVTSLFPEKEVYI